MRHNRGTFVSFYAIQRRGRISLTAPSDAVIAGLGYPYKPKFILTVADLPKTRNMKVMRHLVRAVCLGKSLGDTSSLISPEALETISKAASQSGHIMR